MRGTTCLAIGCLNLFAACGGPTSASPTPTTIAPRIVSLTLDGRVYDTASRPLSGATVELIDGMPAGLAAITDDSGAFSLGDVTLTLGKTKIRASKDGYATSPWTTPPNAPPRARAVISLALLTPPVIRPGEYTMSFVADSACDLPTEARARTYSATITSPPVNLPPEREGTQLNVALSGASFLVSKDVSPYSLLLGSMQVAGDYLYLDLDPWETGYFITERLAPATNLELVGLVAGSVGASGASSVPFDGTFTYCVKQSDTGPSGCSTNDLVYKRCYSKNHRVMLTQR
jgi:hypothetical protein